MKTENQTTVLRAVLTFLRVLIGWHFLYEGISKLAMDNWSASGYLMESKWLLSGFFHWIISDPTALAFVNFLNIWGLIMIGVALFLGMFTRPASIAGMVLLITYYIANPPFAYSSIPAQGQFYIINLNLIESSILLVFALVNKEYLWSFDRLIKVFMDKRKERIFPKADNHEILETGVSSRRELIKNLASLPVLGIALFGMAKKVGWLSFEEDSLSKADTVSSATVISAKLKDIKELQGKVTTGKIKNIELSRIMPGGNLVAGFAHSRDLIYVSSLIKSYFTDEKVIESLWLYEACGMNTVVFRTDEQTIRILKKYWARGGKIQWLAQTYPNENDLSNIQMAIDAGAIGAFVMGGIADKIVFENKLEFIAKPVEFIKSQGLIAGVAGHALQVPKTCVENGIGADFFMKTFHHDKYWSSQPAENRSEFMHNVSDSNDRNQYHDNLWCASSDDVASFFKTCKTPWIAYKVLAAGAIKPEDGIKFAFENGADFVCVGMFDFQIIPNANIVHNTLKSDLKREREWFA